jgi:hypothetical protein
LPATDEYFALAERQATLSGELEEVHATAEALGRFQEIAAARRAHLAALEARTIPSAKLQSFRGNVVELARETKCLIRRVSLGDVRRRDWRPGDDPLEENPVTESKPPSGYVLKVQTASLAVSGKLAGVRDFLSRLAGLNYLIHVNHFALTPADAAGKETNLEFELLLFDLAETERTPKSAPQ